jgi:hypothetical protein
VVVAAAFRRHRRIRQVKENPVRPFAAATSRWSVAAVVKPSRAAVGVRRWSSFIVVLCTVSDVPEENVYIEEGLEAFEEAQGKSHRSQTTL